MGRRKTVIFFLATFFVVFGINFFIYFLTKVWLLTFLSSMLIFSLFLFGIKKENSRFLSDIRLKVIIWTSLLIFVQYFIAINVGFLQNNNSLKILIYTVALIVISEILRYILLFKSNSFYQVILIALIFILVEVASSIALVGFKNIDEIVEFLTVYVLPSISKNILLTYMSKRVGYSPCILYRIILETYVIIIPIIPDFGEYINAIMLIIFPLGFLYSIYSTIEVPKRNYFHLKSNKNNKILTSIGIVLFFIVIYFTSGTFRFYALTIVSGSMEPTINIGDVIIVDKYYKDHINEINLDDVLVFSKHGVTVSHRVIEVKDQGNKIYFYTKGDNNNVMDDWVVEENEVIGVSKFRVPSVGYPVVIWNKVVNKG